MHIKHLGIAACWLLVRLTIAQKTTGVCVGCTGCEPVGEQGPMLMALPGLGMVTGNCCAFAASSFCNIWLLHASSPMHGAYLQLGPVCCRRTSADCALSMMPFLQSTPCAMGTGRSMQMQRPSSPHLQRLPKSLIVVWQLYLTVLTCGVTMPCISRKQELLLMKWRGDPLLTAYWEQKHRAFTNQFVQCVHQIAGRHSAGLCCLHL